MCTIENRFISVEGIDGVGKSTVCEFIKEYIERKTQTKCTIVKQNKDEPLGNMIRGFIRDIDSANKTPKTAFPFLFLAGIAETVENIIQPALENNEWVVSDRYTMSTLVYQHSPMTINLIEEFEKWFATPKYIFLIDAPPQVVKNRMFKRNDITDIFETVPDEMINARRMLFINNDRYSKSEVIVIDGSKSIDEVLKNVEKYLDQIVA